MVQRSGASQEQKFVAFKRAFDIISHYERQGSWLSAYVVCFSMIEDRLRAMLYVRYLSENGVAPSEQKLNQGFSRIVGYLCDKRDIANDLAERLKQEAKARNGLLHAAMWNLDALDAHALLVPKVLMREVDRCRRKQKAALE